MYPKVRLSLSTGTTSGLTRNVIECRLDGAFIAGPLDYPDLHTETVFREELVLVSSGAIRSLDALSAVPDLKTIVFQLGCSYRQRLEALLAEMGLFVTAPLEFGSIDAIVACVATGVGITLLPALSVKPPVAQTGQVRLLRFAEPAPSRRIAMVWRKSSAAGAFLHGVADVIRGLPADLFDDHDIAV